MLDGNMADDGKVRHLMRGVELRLMRDLYPRNVTTSAQFLEYARAHSHAEKLAREKESGSGAVVMAGAPWTGAPVGPGAYGWPHPHPKTVTAPPISTDNNSSAWSSVRAIGASINCASSGVAES